MSKRLGGIKGCKWLVGLESAGFVLVFAILWVAREVSVLLRGIARLA